jgi:serine/threonine-protein kinase
MADALEILRSRLTGRYAVEREVGRGGMATVYLAEDSRHHRPVAIKVLNRELADAIGHERFLREIEIAARLQHPNILPLYDSGEADGLLFYVMPYVEGQSLRERLTRERQLPIDEATRLTREIADALAYAHERGVIHRDIKPENILIESGHAVVADFGIARAVGVAASSKLTETGASIGTPAYMSPEQLIGSSELDGRTDLYSLGCVLYEMLAGTPPFAGVTGESLAHQHLSVEPRPVTAVRPGVPEPVARAVTRALAKAAADRYRTAAEFSAALEVRDAPTVVTRPRLARAVAWAAVAAILLGLAAWRVGPMLLARHTPPPQNKEWILVADFDGPSQDSSLVSATRDLMIAALDQSGIVAVVPSDQIRIALQRAGKPASTRLDAEVAREIAYRSSVRTVVEGRVGRLGQGFSVVVKMVDVDSARTIASESGTASNEKQLIPVLGRIARQMRADLGEHPNDLRATRELSEITTPSFEAYKRYLRGQDFIRKGDSRSSIAMARSALELDPDFGPAWGQMGMGFKNLGQKDSALIAFDQAIRHRDRTDPGRLVIYEASAAELRGHPNAALEIYERGIAMNPRYPALYVDRGVLLANQGRWGEALADYRKAEDTSPFGPSPAVIGNKFYALIVLGQLEEARQIHSRMPAGGRLGRAMTLAVAGAEWDSIEAISAAILQDPSLGPNRHLFADGTVAVVHFVRGQVGDATRTIERLQTEVSTRGWTYSINVQRWNRMELALFSRGLAGDPGEYGALDTTTVGLVTQGMWAADTGDTTRARRLLAALRARPAADLARQGFGPALVAGWIAASTHRWADVIRELGPAALQGDVIGGATIESRPLARWLVAEAYEHLDRPDSAAAYFDRAMSPIGEDQWDSRLCYSFAQRRLVLLYARMGRAKEAREHWDLFSATCTRPDSEMVPLVNEARAALAGIEGMGRASAR